MTIRVLACIDWLAIRSFTIRKSSAYLTPFFSRRIPTIASSIAEGVGGFLFCFDFAPVFSEIVEPSSAANADWT